MTGPPGADTVVVRAAVPGDLAALLPLTARLAAFPVPGHRDAGQIERADHAMLRDAVEHPSPATLVLVADAGERLVGFVLATTRIDYFTAVPHAHVEILTVASGTEGQGIGRLLMQGAEAWAVQRGYPQVTLNVFAANARARAVYDRLGYEPELVRYRKAIPAAPAILPNAGTGRRA